MTVAGEHRLPNPAARLSVHLSYRDPGAALDWMARVGYDVVVRHDDGAGGIAAEVGYGDASLMLAGTDTDYDIPTLTGRSVGGGVYLWVPAATEVDARHQRATDAGAHSVIAPEDTAWGTRRARVLDPEGHDWSIGTYRPSAQVVKPPILAVASSSARARTPRLPARLSSIRSRFLAARDDACVWLDRRAGAGDVRAAGPCRWWPRRGVGRPGWPVVTG